jgi:hypothetical protein
VIGGRLPEARASLPRGVRELRPPAETTLRHHRPDETGCLSVTCWCEQQIVAVPQPLVLAGQTLSCGLRRCKPQEVA